MHAQDLGAVGTDIFLGSEPDAPDACVTIREYGGEKSEYTLGPTVAYENPRIQIVCRAKDYLSARTKSEAVHRAVDQAELSLTGVHYLRIEPLQPPFPIGRDGNDRFLIAFNCAVMKEQS
ncbi:MAG: minor capsid protein [Blastocatellia bacterium]